MSARNAIGVFPDVGHRIDVTGLEGFVVATIGSKDGVKSFDAATVACITVQTVTSKDGTQIAWYDFGGEGPDLLFAHATGFCAAVWKPIADELRTSFRCVGYDLRGHGRSGSPTKSHGRNGWDWERYADDAEAVVSAAELEHPFGVGHSCGGATEALLEERRPGTFRSLYLFEPVIFTAEPPTGPDPDRDLAVRARKRRTTFASREDALAQFSSRGPFTALDRACLDAYIDNGFAAQANGSIRLRLAPDDEAEVYVMASAHDGFSRLDSVKCPTTVAHGADSLAFTREHMQRVAARIPTGTFTTWPGLGHFGPLEKPTAFAAAIERTFSS